MNEIDNDGRTPLSIAIGKGHLEIVKILVEGHADIHYCDAATGKTPLSEAEAGGHIEVIEYLQQEIDPVKYKNKTKNKNKKKKKKKNK